MRDGDIVGCVDRDYRDGLHGLLGEKKLLGMIWYSIDMLSA